MREKASYQMKARENKCNMLQGGEWIMFKWKDDHKKSWVEFMEHPLKDALLTVISFDI